MVWIRFDLANYKISSSGKNLKIVCYKYTMGQIVTLIHRIVVFFTFEFVEHQSSLNRVTLGCCVRFDIDGHIPCSAELKTF